MKEETAFQKVTDRIISLLEEGTIPWTKPFGLDMRPVNGYTKNYYRGENAWLLGLFQYDEPIFMGFKQAKTLGGNVKKGAGAVPVMFPYFNYYDKKTGGKISAKKYNELKNKFGKDRVKKYTGYSYGNVFNISNCEDIEREELPEVSRYNIDFEPIEKCETICREWQTKPTIKHGGGEAFYSRDKDFIQLPKRDHFKSSKDYYAALFHEAIHATGHAKRLDREKFDALGDEKYSFEELVAELGSAILCTYGGIGKGLIENKAAYIDGWLSNLKKSGNKEWILKANKLALKAADHITGGKISQEINPES